MLLPKLPESLAYFLWILSENHKHWSQKKGFLHWLHISKQCVQHNHVFLSFVVQMEPSDKYDKSDGTDLTVPKSHDCCSKACRAVIVQMFHPFDPLSTWYSCSADWLTNSLTQQKPAGNMFAIKMYNLFSMVKNSSQINVFWRYHMHILFIVVKVHESRAVKNVVFHVQKAWKVYVFLCVCNTHLYQISLWMEI